MNMKLNSKNYGTDNMITFDSRNLNQEAWAERARAEAILIHGKDSTRRNRSLEEIYETTKYGHAAEQYLIEEFGFEDDPRIYKDVINTSGDPVEVKVTENENNVIYVLKRCNEAAKEKWRKFPKKLMIFVSPRSGTTYHLHGYYEYNGKEFKKTSVQIPQSIV